MFRRIVTICIAVAVLASGAVAPSQVDAKVPQRVFQDYDQFLNSARQLQKAKTSRLSLSTEAREQRLNRIERMMSTVPHTDTAALEEAAEQLGLLIYTQDEASGDIGIQSDGCCDVDIYQPTMAYDWGLDAWYVRGEVVWNDTSALESEFSMLSTNVGGRDAAGLWFSYLSGYDRNNIFRARITTFDKNWNVGVDGFNSDWTVSDSEDYAVIFSAQDTHNGSASSYNFWRIVTYVWFNHDAPSGGTAYMTYGHTWSKTQFSGVEIGVGGSPNATIQAPEGSITFKFDRVEHRWAVKGTTPLSY